MKKLILLMIVCLIALTGCYTTSEGNRVGTITKFSSKGFLVRTWEGEMILGGSGASGSSVNTWRFSVADESLVAAIQAAQKKAEVITLQYHEEWIVAPWRADTNYLVDAVKE